MMGTYEGGPASVRSQEQEASRAGTLKGEEAQTMAEPQDPVACVWPGTYLDAGTVIRHAGGQGDEN